MSLILDNSIKKITCMISGEVIKKVVRKSDGVALWTAGSTVTYYVDTSVYYTEEVDNEASCLSPKTFTPSKDGWTFVGWREDTTASGSVLSSKVMDSEPVTLYAVFKQTVTAKFVSYNSTQPVDGTRYYNYGSVENASVTVPTGATYSGWSWRGWGNNWVTHANAEVFYANGGQIVGLSEDREYYGLYQKTVTGTFISGLSKANSQTADGNRYYNSYGNTQNATITAPSGASVSGWTWRGWASSGNTSAAASVTYANSASITGVTANFTVYGLYQQTITLSYNGNGATGGSVGNQTGTRYHNSAGNYSNPSFTLANNGFARSGYTFNGWNLGAVGASITLSANATAYAQWVGTPYYPTFADSSLWTKVGTVDNAATPFKAYDSSVEVCAQDNGQMTDFSYSTYQATFNTQGCNKVRLYVKEESGGRGVGSGEVRVISNSGTISQGITTEGKHYLYFDMSGDTFTVQLSVGNASTYYSISVYLYEIYAYCE